MLEIVGFLKGAALSDSAYFHVGDHIIKYDGVRVNTLKELIFQMQKKSIKRALLRKVKIELVRNNRLLTIRVKKGHLSLKIEEKNTVPTPFVDRELLDKANLIIRKANLRINELKQLLAEAEFERSVLKEGYDQVLVEYEEMSRTFSHLDLLGYELLPDVHDLKKRYRQLAAIYHPDKGGSKVMMQKINEAYEKLVD